MFLINKSFLGAFLAFLNDGLTRAVQAKEVHTIMYRWLLSSKLSCLFKIDSFVFLKVSKGGNKFWSRT